MYIAINPWARLDRSSSALRNQIFDEGECIDAYDGPVLVLLAAMIQDFRLFTIGRWLTHNLDILNCPINIKHLKQLFLGDGWWQITNKDRT